MAFLTNSAGFTFDDGLDPGSFGKRKKIGDNMIYPQTVFFALGEACAQGLFDSQESQNIARIINQMQIVGDQPIKPGDQYYPQIEYLQRELLQRQQRKAVEGGQQTCPPPANAQSPLAYDTFGQAIQPVPFNPEEAPLAKAQRRSRGGKYAPGVPIDDFIDDLILIVENQGVSKDNKERIKWLKTFRRCVLPPIVKMAIEEALTVVLSEKKFKDWGIEGHFEKGLTNSILLYGPPGTGKTMIAESFAAVLGMNLIKVTNADLQSQVPGQVERNITDNFKKATKENAVLMFDECDSMLYNRDSVGAILASHTNHLLGAIENHKGVVIMTTNRLGHLDAALQRRIIAKVEIPIPTEAARVDIWKNLMPPKMPLEKEVSFEMLAKVEISGGDIKNAILIAARKAIAANANIVTEQNLVDALESVLSAKKDFAKKSSERERVTASEWGKQMNAEQDAYKASTAKVEQELKMEKDLKIEKEKVTDITEKVEKVKKKARNQEESEERKVS